MPLRIYNTRTKRKEIFKPINAGRVGLYVCGITAYDTCHIGHARSAVVFDVITRYLRHRDYDVIYVRNFTDLDDKIIDKAVSLGLDFSEIAQKYIKEHDEDMAALGILKPTMTPRATEHIEGMITLIKNLIAKGLAYIVDGDVYFAVEKFTGYGKLSGRNLEDMIAGARVDVNEKKENPLDFALWKVSKAGEPWWDSPWGKGRPGWHIECSVMSQKYLGETLDIHGGGEDLIFPHHENEIAQSEGATGKPLANFWIHHGFVRINREKMSKSLNNVFTIKEILGNYHPDVLRFFIMQVHYRNPLDFSDDALVEARHGMERFYNTLKKIRDILKGAEISFNDNIDCTLPKNRDMVAILSQLPGRFADAMDDDFNTAKAMGILFDSIRLINGYLTDKEFAINAETIFMLNLAKRTFETIGQVFGIFLEDPDDYFRKDRDREAGKRGLNIEEIERLVEERRIARLAKNWQKADEIRNLLAGMRVVLQDTPTSSSWNIA